MAGAVAAQQRLESRYLDSYKEGRCMPRSFKATADFVIFNLWPS